VTIKLPKIYPVTDVQLSGLSHSEQVERLLAGGASLVQLREKNLPAQAFYAAAAAAVRLARSAGAKIIINDRVDVALALQADGVHLGQSDLPVAAARRLLGDGAVIGYSTHNLEQVRAALRLSIDYLAFGPIFPTNSKQNPDPVAGLNALARVQSLAAPLPVVAIGGINQTNLRAVLDGGANSAAIISAIVGPPEAITERFRDLTALAD